MSDKGPHYPTEAKRLELELLEHHQTIEKGKARLVEIASSKRINLQRAELANLVLDDEADRLRVNEEALAKTIEETEKNLKLMTKPGATDG